MVDYPPPQEGLTPKEVVVISLAISTAVTLVAAIALVFVALT